MRTLLPLLLSLVTATSPALAQSKTQRTGDSPAPDRKPNVLLICVDDLKPLLGCYGDTKAKTPNIDRLARRGVLFEKAYCNQAVCAPSRNALLTGLRSTTLGIYDLQTYFRKAAPDAVTLPQLFIQHGYHAESLGKIYHVGHGNQDDAASWSVPHWRPTGGDYALPESRITRDDLQPPAAAGRSRARGAPTECADVPDSTYADGLIADEAIRRLQAVKKRPGQPFFLAVGFLKPHLPFVAPKKYWDLYERDSLALAARGVPPEGAPEFAPTTWGELRQYFDMPQIGPVTDAQARQLIHGYYACVSFIDAQIGRVLNELERLGMEQNTVVVLWGDHGFHLGDLGMWCKHTNYEQAARIPIIMAAPGVAKNGARCRALIESVDIYPTLCELAGLPVPRGLDGSSLVAALKQPESAPAREAIFHVYPRSTPELGQMIGRAVRTERYRLVEWKQPGAPAETAVLELYDYATDPDETRNLASERPRVVKQLRAILAKQPEAKPQWRPPVRSRAGNE